MKGNEQELYPASSALSAERTNQDSQGKMKNGNFLDGVGTHAFATTPVTQSCNLRIAEATINA
jgi:hypothetical protein